MLEITESEIKRRIVFDNPWWESGTIPEQFRAWPYRQYFDGFIRLVKQKSINRAVVLMGPRRVGKTVMLIQSIQNLINEKVAPEEIFYVSVGTPVYTGLSLEQLLRMFMDVHGHDREKALFVIFDEIQYLQDWERHLKSLVDSFPSMRFVASGSAAAALKLKSQESGAGRFTNLLLPPLNFSEFLYFTGWTSDRSHTIEHLLEEQMPEIEALNDAFVDYINFGGFPESVIKPEVRQEMDRFVADDIVGKVLLRDIPSLYGIADSQELKRFFTVLAYNTGMEVSFESLSQSAGIAKNTIRKYLDYLEAAFLIHRVHRLDQNARRFKRVTHFKVYLTNPCIRSALFGPVSIDSEAMGPLAETALFCQYIPTVVAIRTYYARWNSGEVDAVRLSSRTQKIQAVEEIKWSDRCAKNPQNELKSLVSFCKKNKIKSARVYTKSAFIDVTVDGVDLGLMPLSLSCWMIADVWVNEALQAGEDPQTLDPLSQSNVSDDKANL